MLILAMAKEEVGISRNCPARVEGTGKHYNYSNYIFLELGMGTEQQQRR